MPGKVDTKTISENLEVQVAHKDADGYTVVCINKNNTGSLAVRVNFESCVNLKPEAAAGCKAIGTNVVEVNVPPGASVTAANLTPIDPNAKFSYKYTCATQLRKAPAGAAAPAPAPTPAAAAPARTSAPAPAKKPAAKGNADAAAVPEGVEETERKVLTDNLEILIHSINNGYNLQIQSKDAAATFTVVLDLSESQNLEITAEGDCTVSGTNATIVIKPQSTVSCVDMPVKDWDLGSCELRYKASIRKT